MTTQYRPPRRRHFTPGVTVTASSTSIRRRLIGIAMIAATVSVLAACGSSSSSGGGGASTTTESNGNRQPSAAFRGSSVSGTIKSVGSAGVAVKTSTGTSNVAFGTTTRFTTVSDASRSDVKSGDCISAGSKDGSFGATELTATSISITSTSSCQDGFGGGFGGGAPRGGLPSGVPTGVPTGAPTGLPPQGGSTTGGAPTGTPPSGAPGGGFGGRGPGGFGGALGTVTSVSGSTIVIKSVSGSKTTITTTDNTTYSSRSTGKASDAMTGKCLSAFGQTSGTTLDAATVTISSPSGGKCQADTAGFGGLGLGPRSGAPTNGGSNG